MIKNLLKSTRQQGADNFTFYLFATFTVLNLVGLVKGIASMNVFEAIFSGVLMVVTGWITYLESIKCQDHHYIVVKQETIGSGIDSHISTHMVCPECARCKRVGISTATMNKNY